jgi:TRAP-type C4-dicarboxylate transport system permease small subunit
MHANQRHRLHLLFIADRVIGQLVRISDQLSAAVCAFLIAATTFSVIVYQQGITIVWLDDLLRMLLIWLVYLGAVSISFRNDHIAMDALSSRLPPPARRVLEIAVAVLGIGLAAYVAKIGYESMERDIAYGTLLASGYLPAWPQTLAIPLCFGLMTLSYLGYLYDIVARRRVRSHGDTHTDGS